MNAIINVGNKIKIYFSPAIIWGFITNIATEIVNYGSITEEATINKNHGDL